MTTETVQTKLKGLPKTPGVYFHKSADGEVIYIGKAAVLRNRVRQYFQKSRNRDPKTEALVAEIADIEWIEVETEMDALFLEAEMVKRYLPRYNIMLRDDKSLSYVRIDLKSDYPTVTYTRRPLDDKADYFGPYLEMYQVRKALRLLRRIFPYATTREQATMGSKLYEQIGLDPGLRSGKTDLESYRKNLRLLMSYLRGNRVKLMKEIEKEMKKAASEQDFEKAAALRNKLLEMKALKKQVIFSDREFMDISKDKGLQGLATLLTLEQPPKRVEGYDISHMSGTDNVASMVVFTSGLPDKTAYRKFKMRIRGNDDFAHMREVITRRLSEKNVKSWGLPDLFLIDGGKGQLSAALHARDEQLAKLRVLRLDAAQGSKEERTSRTKGTVSERQTPADTAMRQEPTKQQARTAGSSVVQKPVPMIGLAKREEEVIISKNDPHTALLDQTLIARNLQQDVVVQESEDFYVVRLGQSSDIVKLLQRIRDESHRFAVSYHSTLKSGRQTASWLDEVPGIGPATKKKLIRTFGSAKGVTQARKTELENLLGEKQATILHQYIRAEKKV